MKALVYHGPGQKAWEHVPDPKIINPTDVIVQVDITTICGTDLHILKGDVPAVTEGRILGHEGVGTITEVGQAVSKLAVGDRVIISCVTSCGSCSYCHQQLPSHCLDDEGASGILCSEPSAKGTRTYSAWVPLMRWPKIQPMPEVPSSSRQCAGRCWRQ
jgi:alcohol dehydrogenase